MYETDNPVAMGRNGYADLEPGVIFKYRISPFMHVIQEDRKPLSSLLVRICAVIGGTMAVGMKKVITTRFHV